MNLPFGLKVKPQRHYFNGGSIHFQVENGTMYYEVTTTVKITRNNPFKLKYDRKEVMNKEHLDQLLKVKTFTEIPSLEIVK